MRYSILLFIVILAGLGFWPFIPGQKADTDYKARWSRIDSLEALGLYRQALSGVNQIYSLANSDHKPEEELKALIYKLRFINVLSEDGYQHILNEMEKERQDDRIAFRALKSSMLAELYVQYYQNNRWQIFKNSNDLHAASDHPETWSPSRFGEYIRALVRESLENSEITGALLLDQFREVLTDSLLPAGKLSLFDLISLRALEIYGRDELDFSPNLISPLLMDTMLFSPRQDFVAWIDENAEDTSFTASSLKVFSDLIKHHLKDTCGAELLHYDLKRLSYAFEVSLFKGDEKKYMDALTQLEKETCTDSLLALIFYEKATFYRQRSNNYKINSADTALFRADKKSALSWAGKAISESPGSRPALQSQNLINEILAPSLSVVTEAVSLPGKSIPVSIEYCNTGDLWYRIFPVEPGKAMNNGVSPRRGSGEGLLPETDPVFSAKLELPDKGDYNRHRLTIAIPPLQEGNYSLIVSGSPEPESKAGIVEKALIRISGIAWLTKKKDNGMLTVYVTDRYDGKPLEGVQVQQFFRQFDPRNRVEQLLPGRKFVSDGKGCVEIRAEGTSRSASGHEPFHLLFGTSDSGILSPENFSLYPPRESPESRLMQRVFTDRGIYRPGQTVKFTGLIINDKKGKLEIPEPLSLDVYIQDTRYRNIDTLSLSTDKFGYFRGDFIIPDEALGGNYQIISPWGRQSFKVEQYKRPGFRIMIDQDTRIYQPGDSISIRGSAEAFAGMTLKSASAEIDAYLNLRGFHPFKQRFSGKRILLKSTSSLLDDDGRFEWTVPGIEYLGNAIQEVDYEFVVKVRDINGETRDQTHRVLVSKFPLKAAIEGPSKVDLRKGGEWTINTYAPGNRRVEVPVLIRIGSKEGLSSKILPYPLPEPDTWIMDEQDWLKLFPSFIYNPAGKTDSITQSIFSGSYTTGKDGISLEPDFSGWKPGSYRIMVSPAENPEKIAGQYDFELFNSGSRSFPTGKPLWLALSETSTQPGEVLDISLGTIYPGNCLIEISGRDSVYFSDWMMLNKRRKELTIRVSEQMRGNIQVQVHGVHQNNHFSQQQLILIPWENKNLIVTGLDSIPDAEPGEKIRLNVNVMDLNNKPVEIQGVATVYDSSLDDLSPHSWQGFGWPIMTRAVSWEAGGFGRTGSRTLFVPPVIYFDIPPLPECRLNWFGLGYYGIQNYGGRELAYQPSAMRTKTGVTDDAAGEEGEVFLTTDSGDQTPAIPDEQVITEIAKEVYFRTDFRETACYISDFKTDSSGKGTIEFIVPEAITEWKIKFYAHDMEMAQALLDEEFKSRKLLMLLPNFPRFVRAGDIVDLPVKMIYNAGEGAEVKAGIKITDGLDTASLLFEDELVVNVSPFYNENLSWTFAVPENVDYLQISLFSTDGNYSDGIKLQIPVLPRELDFWESNNFFMKDPGERNLISEEGVGKAVLELNTRPLWMAVKSLPVFSGSEIPCSEYWFTRFFTAKLIWKITNEYPAISSIIKKMAAEAVNDTRMINFSKNQEMRRFMLDNGLWQGAGDEELIQLTALAEMFAPDINKRETDNSLNRLIQLQLPDGSWPWFQGMQPDFRMSMHILAGIGELTQMGLFDNSDGSTNYQMISKAVGYADRTVNEIYNRHKLASPKEDPGLTGELIHYLYARSYFPGIKIPDQYSEAFTYYFEKAGKDWLRWSISHQVFIALAYLRSGEQDIPVKVFNSLSDRKLETAEGAVYWKVEPIFRGWMDRDIWQQSRIIELFNSMEEGKPWLDGIKTWLIQQKRSRDWGDRISTALALKSLIFYGSNWHEGSSSLSIDSGNEFFSPVRIKLGTDAGGYYRYKWDKPEAGPLKLDLKITKEDSQPVWGSLFTRQTSGLDTLKAAGQELAVQRMILMESVVNGRKTWIPAEGNEIQTGQRIIIRLEVEASQAVDYVQLRDYRPSAFEPDKSLSGYRWGNNTAWYQMNKDLFTDFYIAHLPKGFSFFEYSLYAEQSGEFNMGYAEIQSQYAPEFTGRSSGGRIVVKN